MATSPILIAGKHGQLATCLFKLATRQEVPVVALGRREMDITDRVAVRRAVSACKPRLIINAAAYTAVDDAESDPSIAFAVNRDGAGHLADLAQQDDIPYIHLSTDYVFDGHSDSPYQENDVASPLNVYGRSKLAGEALVAQACPSALILRTSWVYSPYGRNFVTTLLRLGADREVLRVVNDQHGNPTSAYDLAGAILSLERHLGPGRGGIFHLSGSGVASWYSLAKSIFAGWAARGRRVPRLEPTSSSQYETVAARPMNSSLDCRKADLAFGLQLPPWGQSLERCLEQISSGKGAL